MARALHSQLRIQLFHQALHKSSCFHIAHVGLLNCVNSNVLINHKQPFLLEQLVQVSKGGSVEAACQPVCHFGEGTHALIEALPVLYPFHLWGSLPHVIAVMMKALISPTAQQYCYALCTSPCPGLPACHLPRGAANKCIMTDRKSVV